MNSSIKECRRKKRKEVVISMKLGSNKLSIACDVLVCGGGCAGLDAALALARNGAKIVLVERARICRRNYDHRWASRL